MRSCRAVLSAAVIVLALTAGTASAQPPTQPPPRKEPMGTPPPLVFDGFHAFTPNTGTLTGGGYDVQFGYWVRGGPSDSPSPVWPGPAYTPFSASPYGLGHPVGTGFYMGPPGGAYGYGYGYGYPGAVGKHHLLRHR